MKLLKPHFQSYGVKLTLSTKDNKIANEQTVYVLH